MMSVTGYIFIVCEGGKELKVKETLEKTDGFCGVRILYGPYDLVAKAERSSLRELDSLVLKVRSMPEVVRTVTLVSL